MQRDQKFNIREARKNDAAILARLSGELGYPTTMDEMENRFNKLTSTDDQCIYVAEHESVVGWIHVAVIQTLESNAYAEICGLVVAETFRGSGIGTQLVAKGEKWAKERGYTKIRVRTNILREETRKFYRKLGYQARKTQEVFDKIIDIDSLTGGST
jgi:ribosomal protein S18 acetylase RimI-like enzyme